MLHRTENLIGMHIHASDGDIGKVEDVYFDDQRWAVRYLVVETGGWLLDRKVLISPFAVKKVDWVNRIVKIELNQKQVKESPHVDTDKPVSRQHETDLLSYYGYPNYWNGLFLWGTLPYPITPTEIIQPVNDIESGQPVVTGDPHLRSMQEVVGYHLHATDGSIGHLDDFLLDSTSWAIRYIVVDTRNWWPGKHVVIPPQWIKQLDWVEKIVTVDVTRDTVQRASEYDPEIEFSRELEADLYRHSQRPNYWQ